MQNTTYDETSQPAIRMNRGMRRRMKRDLKLDHTPSQAEASALIVAGYQDSPFQRVEKDEPVKVRVPRAFEGSDDAAGV